MERPKIEYCYNNDFKPRLTVKNVEQVKELENYADFLEQKIDKITEELGEYLKLEGEEQNG